MIRAERYCCEDISKIENYELAKKDNFKGWCCHHRLETHTSDGERRIIDLTVEELKSLDIYFDRPPEELIFMKFCQHMALHSPRRFVENPSTDTQFKKDQIPWNKGKKYEVKQKGMFESKKVLCVELNIVFDSVSDANIFIGQSPKSGHISMVCKGKRKTTGGYTWKYVK